MLNTTELRQRMQPHSDADLSRLTGIHRVTLSRVRHGHQEPALETAALIYKAVCALELPARPAVPSGDGA